MIFIYDLGASPLHLMDTSNTLELSSVKAIWTIDETLWVVTLCIFCICKWAVIIFYWFTFSSAWVTITRTCLSLKNRLFWGVEVYVIQIGIWIQNNSIRSSFECLKDNCYTKYIIQRYLLRSLKLDLEYRLFDV